MKNEKILAMTGDNMNEVLPKKSKQLKFLIEMQKKRLILLLEHQSKEEDKTFFSNREKKIFEEKFKLNSLIMKFNEVGLSRLKKESGRAEIVNKVLSLKRRLKNIRPKKISLDAEKLLLERIEKQINDKANFSLKRIEDWIDEEIILSPYKDNLTKAFVDVGINQKGTIPTAIQLLEVYNIVSGQSSDALTAKLNFLLENRKKI